jgi:7-cyano-7-deazaguanine reductase
LLGISEPLPFAGEDLWTAWDLSWLGPDGKPAVAVASLRVPASSACLVESKSLKLYLDSLAMARFEAPEAVAATIAGDFSRVCEATVAVSLVSADEGGPAHAPLPGRCIDDTDTPSDTRRVDAALLRHGGEAIVDEVLHSHLLRSLCPVTGQPDIGSIVIEYRGRAIDGASLLRYLVSYRAHSDFHESCVERIFIDLKARCRPDALSVHARYNRRGGLDINPFRSDSRARASDMRLWRQ